MNYILFDEDNWEALLPLTYTRPVSEIRIGILTIKEKWDIFLNSKCSYKTKDYLQKKYPLQRSNNNVLINSSALPEQNLVHDVLSLKEREVLVKNDEVIAIHISDDDLNNFTINNISAYKKRETNAEFILVENPWDIFKKNEKALSLDFNLLTKNRKSFGLSDTNNVIGVENLFIEQGAKLEYTTINASKGPVYIGKNSEIMEGALIRGPFALCDHSEIKLGAKIYGATTIGPFSKIGGEVKNSVIFGYSNKAHEGYLGNSVVGEWCNMGADSNNSNLKNNYKNVRMWDYSNESFIDTGLQFCGLIMGDHSKCGINTMFNTGTSVGVFANVFGAGFLNKLVPSFSWGGLQKFSEYELSKAFEVAKIVMKRKNLSFSQEEQNILTKVFECTKFYRKN